MTLSNLRLRISTPAEPIVPGRGFYQLEEDALYVQIGLFTGNRPFFSYLESEHTRFDIDRNGRLIFIEIALPRRQWPVDPDLKPPEIIEPADIRFLNFRDQFPTPRLATNKRRTRLALLFDDVSPVRNYYLAEHVIARVDQSDHLAAVWIDDIIDDLAGQEIGAARRKSRHDEPFFG